MDKYERKSDDSADYISQEDDLSYHSALSDTEENFLPIGEPQAELQEKPIEEEKKSESKLVIGINEPLSDIQRSKESNRRIYEHPKQRYRYQKKGEASNPDATAIKEINFPNEEIQVLYQDEVQDKSGKWKPKKEQVRYVKKEKKQEESTPYVDPATTETDIQESFKELKLGPIIYEDQIKYSKKYVRKKKQSEEEQFSQIPETVPVEPPKQKVEYKKKSKQKGAGGSQGERKVMYRKKEVDSFSRAKVKLNAEAKSFASHHAKEMESEIDLSKLSTGAAPFKPKKKSDSPTKQVINTSAMGMNTLIQPGISPVQIIGIPFQFPTPSFQPASMMPGYPQNYQNYPY